MWKVGFLSAIAMIAVAACPIEGGDIIGPAGGYVFYDKGSYSDGWRYLECAPKDVGRDVDWDEAQKLCDDYSFGGYDDWFLPNKAELNFLYENINRLAAAFEVGSYNAYWSATEEGKKAWCQYFGSAETKLMDKHLAGVSSLEKVHARAIHRF
jgi:hypothetical protein